MFGAEAVTKLMRKLLVIRSDAIRIERILLITVVASFA